MVRIAQRDGAGVSDALLAFDGKHARCVETARRNDVRVAALSRGSARRARFSGAVRNGRPDRRTRRAAGAHGQIDGVWRTAGSGGVKGQTFQAPGRLTWPMDRALASSAE